MLEQKRIKRLVVCFGSIQLVTALSVLSYREKLQQEQNLQYENYLLITPLFAPQGQNEEFAALIEKMARSICSWEKIVYMSSEQKKAFAKKLQQFGLQKVTSLVRDFVGSKSFDEIYLAHEYDFEDQLLMNVYETAEKICYGNGIGIYTAQSAFPKANQLRDSQSYSHRIYTSLKEKVKLFLPQKQLLKQQKFDIGYFSLPSAFGQAPSMPAVTLSRDAYRAIFQKLRENLEYMIDIPYVKSLRAKIQANSTSILLTTNFSEAGRISLENEISAYRVFLEERGISNDEILLVKPHPRDSKFKLVQLKSALSELYSDIVLLTEDFLFYLPFEVFFMELFLNPDLPKLPKPKIYTFSSACLTLEFILDAQCIVGFGSEIANNFFYPDHIDSRIKHESDLLSAIERIKNLNAALV